MKALALLVVLLLAVLLLPAKHMAVQPLSCHEPLCRLAPVRVVRSPRAAHVPKTVRVVNRKPSQI
jgi:hypothetical protein